MPTISVVIPCLNESQTIGIAVQEAFEGIRLAGMQGEVIVADNGSTDGSPDIAVGFGARVVHVDRRGYGAALHNGILHSQSDFVVFADADLSYPFLEIKKLISPLLDSNVDIVLGSRLLGSIQSDAMPLLNRFLGTPILSFLIRKLYRLPCSDCNSGMRSLRRSKYDQLSLRCPGMEYASEMLIRASQENFRYVEVSISFKKDQRGKPPHLRRWRDGWRHLRFILGNSTSQLLIFAPGIIGLLMLLLSLLLSFQDSLIPKFFEHDSIIFMVISMPFLLFTETALLVKVAYHESSSRQSVFIAKIQSISETATFFYSAVVIYFLSFIQCILVVINSYQSDFAQSSDGGIARMLLLIIIATLLFSLDLGMGLLKLIPYEKTLDKVEVRNR